MERQDTTTVQPEKFFSGANNIPEKRQIVQRDVNDALLEIQGKRMVSHSQSAAQHRGGYGPGMEWSEKLSAAYDTLHCARRHQPGEAGSSTFGARSTRPGTIVRE